MPDVTFKTAPFSFFPLPINGNSLFLGAWVKIIGVITDFFCFVFTYTQ